MSYKVIRLLRIANIGIATCAKRFITLSAAISTLVAFVSLVPYASARRLKNNSAIIAFVKPY